MIMALQAMKGGGAESTVRTSEGVTIRTRFTLPILQAVALGVSFCAVVGGLFLMTWGVVWLLDLDWDMRSYLAVWSVLLVAAWLASLVYGRLSERHMEGQPQAVKAFAATAALLVVGLVVGSLLLTVREKFGIELVSMVVGAGLVLGAVALGFNQSQDLIAGYWRRSPYEEDISREILPALRKLLERGAGGADDDVRTEDTRYTVRNGGRYGVVARPVGVQRPQVDDWGDHEGEETELITIDPEEGNLVWFVRFAARQVSLSIDDLTVRPPPMLPFPEGGKERRLRRDMIRRLVVRGSTAGKEMVDGHEERGLGEGGFWELQGQGATPEWVVERSEAQQVALEMWRRVYGDELPVPDYYQDRDKAA